MSGGDFVRGAHGSRTPERTEPVCRSHEVGRMGHVERPCGSPDAATAAVRRAVRAALADLVPGDLVLVACSGGADSLALAAALAFEAHSGGWRAGAVVVDHALPPGAAEV